MRRRWNASTFGYFCTTSACSFEEMKFHDSTAHPTFIAACRSRGLSRDDPELVAAMEEADVHAMPSQPRDFFVQIPAFSRPSNPPATWGAHGAPMSKDFHDHRVREARGNESDVLRGEALNEALDQIQRSPRALGVNQIQHSPRCSGSSVQSMTCQRSQPWRIGRIRPWQHA